MAELKIEINKKYKNATGDTVAITNHYPGVEEGARFLGENLSDKKLRFYSEEGIHSRPNKDALQNLVEEVVVEKKKAFIVWNADKTEGFVTTSKCLSYEVRKSASTNCTTEEGRRSPVAEAFCKEWYMDNCIVEEIEVDVLPEHEVAEILDIRENEKKSWEEQ